MSLDLSFDRIRRQQCNLFRFHRHRSPGTTRVVTPALPPSALHWALVGRSDGTRAQFIISHRASRFADMALRQATAALPPGRRQRRRGNRRGHEGINCYLLPADDRRRADGRGARCPLRREGRRHWPLQLQFFLFCSGCKWGGLRTAARPPRLPQIN